MSKNSILTTSKLPADVLHRTKVLAAQRKTTIANLIGEVMRPALDRMERESFARFARPATEKK